MIVPPPPPPPTSPRTRPWLRPWHWILLAGVLLALCIAPSTLRFQWAWSQVKPGLPRSELLRLFPQLQEPNYTMVAADGTEIRVFDIEHWWWHCTVEVDVVRDCVLKASGGTWAAPPP